MMIVLTAIVLMLLIKAFVVQVYRIPSASMEDTLLTGDRVLVNKLAAAPAAPAAGLAAAGLAAAGFGVPLLARRVRRARRRRGPSRSRPRR
jgi:Signal peptidase, peptidase S26